MVLTGDIGVVCVHHSTEVVLETSKNEMYVQLTIFQVTTRMVHPMLYVYLHQWVYNQNERVPRLRVSVTGSPVFGSALCSKYQFIFLPCFSPSMGRLRRSRVHNARRDVHRASRTRVSVLILTFKHFLMNIYRLGLEI